MRSASEVAGIPHVSPNILKCHSELSQRRARRGPDERSKRGNWLEVREMRRKWAGFRFGSVRAQRLAVAETSNPPGGRTHPDEIEGRYGNHFTIGYNAFEVILVFGQFYEGNAQPQLHTRIVTGPAYAKDLLELLRESLEQYEKFFGPLPTGKRP